MRMKITMVLMCCLLAAACEARLELGSPFSDGAVLQREMPVPVWGWAKPGSKIVVAFAGHEATTIADGSGRWQVVLPAMKASAESRTLRVSGDGELAVKDVLVGEVWFVSGQSNCEFPLVGYNPHNTDEDGGMTAQLTHKPDIRFLKAALYQTATKPCERTAKPVEWKKFLPENLSVPGGFSAVGVYFALELYEHIRIPVGLVGVYWGATCIEPWIPSSGFASIPEFQAESRWLVKDKKTFEATGGLKPLVPTIDDYHNTVNQQPAAIWNALVAPLAPYAMRGLVWYQGCSNKKSPERYCKMMHALYNGWAKEFGLAKMKLYYAQLAPYSDDWPALWEQQAQFEREQPNAAMAIINDVGCTSDIHPNRKRPVGRRLAVHALKRDYGLDIVDNSPTLKSWKLDGNRFVLSFNDVKSWGAYNADWSIWTGFEIAGADGKFRPARIENLAGGAKKTVAWKTKGDIKGRDLVVVADDVAEPKTLRYLYARPWKGCLFNEVSLPLGAFKIEVR